MAHLGTHVSPAVWHNFTFFLTTFLSFPGSHDGQVAAVSDGVFQTAFPPFVEEHHIPQEEQGVPFITSQTHVVRDMLNDKLILQLHSTNNHIPITIPPRYNFLAKLFGGVVLMHR